MRLLAASSQIGKGLSNKSYVFRGYGMKLRINVLCMVGAILGIIALNYRWFLIGSPYGNQGGFPAAFTPVFMVFLLGSIIALASPLGGFLQLYGCSSFFYVFAQSSTWRNDIDPTLDVGWFPYMTPIVILAIVATAITLASLIFPLGIGFHKGLIKKFSRFLTVSSVDTEPSSRNLKINSFCLAGAIIGLGSAFLIWISGIPVLFPQGGASLSAIDYAYCPNGAPLLAAITNLMFQYSEIHFAIIIFLVGTGLALVTPLGGFLQLSGLIAFWSFTGESMGTHVAHPEVEWTLSYGPGSYVALFAVFIVLSSPIFQACLYRRAEKPSLRERFLVWTD